MNSWQDERTHKTRSNVFFVSTSFMVVWVIASIIFNYPQDLSKVNSVCNMERKDFITVGLTVLVCSIFMNYIQETRPTFLLWNQLQILMWAHCLSLYYFLCGWVELLLLHQKDHILPLPVHALHSTYYILLNCVIITFHWFLWMCHFLSILLTMSIDLHSCHIYFFASGLIVLPLSIILVYTYQWVAPQPSERCFLVQ